jgi:hypothetical protein
VNNPATQARNFEIACAAVANSATGFHANGAVLAGAEARGYVIGTLFGGVWQWNWLTTWAADVVINCGIVAPWVAL